MSTQHIAYNPLTGHICLGRINPTRATFVGQTRDVTSMVLGAIVDKAAFHGGKFGIQRQDGKRWIVTVQDEPSAAKPTEPMVRHCPDCGHLGPVADGARDCCPDGSHARQIPKAFAEQCRATFLRGISK